MSPYPGGPYLVVCPEPCRNLLLEGLWIVSLPSPVNDLRPPSPDTLLPSTVLGTTRATPVPIPVQVLLRPPVQTITTGSQLRLIFGFPYPRVQRSSK